MIYSYTEPQFKCQRQFLIHGVTAGPYVPLGTTHPCGGVCVGEGEGQLSPQAGGRMYVYVLQQFITYEQVKCHIFKALEQIRNATPAQIVSEQLF